jgi:hypothetical protein
VCVPYLPSPPPMPYHGRRYTDFVEVGRDLALHLRQEEHCDLVIALTHMRAPNDERLARSVAEIDVVLGGHDHDYVRRTRVEGCVSLVPFASACAHLHCTPAPCTRIPRSWAPVLRGPQLLVVCAVCAVSCMVVLRGL